MNDAVRAGIARAIERGNCRNCWGEKEFKHFKYCLNCLELRRMAVVKYRLKKDRDFLKRKR